VCEPPQSALRGQHTTYYHPSLLKRLPLGVCTAGLELQSAMRHFLSLSFSVAFISMQQYDFRSHSRASWLTFNIHISAAEC
jgi:hypothetical protein